jgi:hypothetical protein
MEVKLQKNILGQFFSYCAVTQEMVSDAEYHCLVLPDGRLEI